MSRTHEFNCRTARARDMAMAVIHALEDFIPRSARGGAYNALLAMLEQSGAEVITDDVRKAAGLPPRGPYGTTAEELHAMENYRLRALLAPLPATFSKNDCETE